MQDQNNSNSDEQPIESGNNTLSGLGSSTEPNYQDYFKDAPATGSSFGLHSHLAWEEGAPVKLYDEALGAAGKFDQSIGLRGPGDVEKDLRDQHQQNVKNLQDKIGQIPSGGIIDSVTNWAGEQAPMFGLNAAVAVATLGTSLPEQAAATGLKAFAGAVGKSAAIGAGLTVGGDAVTNMTTNVTGDEKVGTKSMAQDALLGAGVGVLGHVAVDIVGRGFRAIKGRSNDPNTVNSGTPDSEEKRLSENAQDIIKGQSSTDTAKIAGSIDHNQNVTNLDKAQQDQPLGQADEIADKSISESENEENNMKDEAVELAKNVPSDIKDYSDGELIATKKILDEYSDEDPAYEKVLKKLNDKIGKKLSKWDESKLSDSEDIMNNLSERPYDAAVLHTQGAVTHSSPYLDERASSERAAKSISEAPDKAFSHGRANSITADQAIQHLNQNDGWDHELNTTWVSTIGNKSRRVEKLSEDMNESVKAKRNLPSDMSDYLDQTGHPSIQELGKFVKKANQARQLGDIAESKRNYLESAKGEPLNAQNSMIDKINTDNNRSSHIETYPTQTIAEPSKEFGLGDPTEESGEKTLETMDDNNELTPAQQEEIRQQKINEVMGQGDEGFVKAAVACLTGNAISEPTITVADKLKELEE